jgi:hypothetical protein
MNEKIISAVGQSLLAIGLYTVAFESMVLSFRGRMYDYIKGADHGSLNDFWKACNTADKTFKFCTPKLVKLGIIESTDVEALTSMRKRRNSFAHEGYNNMMSLSVSDVEDDVQLMFRITRKVEQWMPASSPMNPDGSFSFSISPAIFGMYLQIARDIAYSKLPLERNDERA